MALLSVPSWLEALDEPVDLAFDRVRGRRFFDRLFYSASAVGDHGILWVIIGAVQAMRGGRHRQAAKRVMVGVILESIIVNVGVKSLFHRVRPVVAAERPLPLRIPITSSFPSGHAASAFCAAVLLSDDDPRMAPVFYTAATVVALSRIHVKIHHASDVAGGVAVGLLLGHLGKRISPLPQELPSPPTG
jgi:undecaprenyl-diphosphatase